MLVAGMANLRKGVPSMYVTPSSTEFLLLRILIRLQRTHGRSFYSSIHTFTFTKAVSDGCQPVDEPLAVVITKVETASPVAAALAASAAAAAAAEAGVLGASPSATDDGIRPQGRTTRLSCHLAPDIARRFSSSHGSISSEVKGDTVDSERVRRRSNQDVKLESEDKEPVSSHELPSWRVVAEEVETAKELCVGDVVRVRCDWHSNQHLVLDVFVVIRLTTRGLIPSLRLLKTVTSRA